MASVLYINYQRDGGNKILKWLSPTTNFAILNRGMSFEFARSLGSYAPQCFPPSFQEEYMPKGIGYGKKKPMKKPKKSKKVK